MAGAITFGGGPTSVPALREDLRLSEGAVQRDGSPTWLIQDPVLNRFISIGWLEFELLLRWHLSAPDKIIAQTNAETPLDVSRKEFDEFYNFLSARQLLAAHSPAHTDELIANYARAQKTWGQWLLHNYLFFRIPLWHPERWLARALPWVAWIFTAKTVVGISVLGLVALFMTLQQIDFFFASFLDTLTPQGAVGYLIALGLTKSLHELGHALTATRHGVRVAHMGVAFLVMWPVLYTDTGESWRLKGHKQRLSIATAGIVTEMGLAVLALFVWNWAPPGAFRDSCFFIATTALLLTLAINASPFLRFDGYYILSDLLDMPNLHERAGAFAKRWQRNHLLGWHEPAPEDASPTRANLLTAFAYLTWTYRLVLFLGIAVAVYLFFFKALGIFLFAVEIWWFVTRPIYKELAVWYERRSEINTPHRLMLAGFVLAVLLAALVPWDHHVKAPAWIHSATSQVIYSPESGRIVSLPKGPGMVKEGTVLFVLDRPDSKMRSAVARVEKTALEQQLAGLMGVPGGEVRRVSLSKQWYVQDAQEKAEADLLASLRLTAAQDGVVMDIEPTLAPGVWVNSDQPLAVLADPTTWVVDAYLAPEDRDRIAIGNSAKFFDETNPLVPLSGRVIEIDSQRTIELSNMMLSPKYGGTIAVEADGRGLTPKNTLYRIRLALDRVPEQFRVARGTVVVDAEPRIPFVELLRNIAVVLVREASF